MLTYLQEMWYLATQGHLQGVWFWAAFYTFLVCAYSVSYQLRVRNWPSTLGTLQRARISEFGAPELVRSERVYHADTSYTYTIQGDEYTGHRVSPWIILTNMTALLNYQLKRISSTENGKVKVFYHLHKPQKSYLLLPGMIGVGITLVLSLLPAIGYYLRFYT